MQEPHDLVGMANAVGRELRRHDEVDAASVGLGDVGEPPEERLREHLLGRIPLERDGDEVSLVAAPLQLRDEIVDEDLGAAALERHLRAADRDPHGRRAPPGTAGPGDPTSPTHGASLAADASHVCNAPVANA
jgi:hypothetical protein